MVADDGGRRARRALQDRRAAARMAAHVAVALGARPVEHGLARRLQRVQDGIGIGQRARVVRSIASASAFTLGDENCVCWKLARSSRKLAGGSTATPAWLRSALERLVLQRVDAAVELVAAARIRPSRPRRSGAIGTGDAGVEDGRNGAPDVGDGLAGRLRRCRARDLRPAVEQLDVRGQRDRDANEAVLRQVREVVRGRAVDAEVVGVDRAEQRIVDARRRHLRKPCLRRRRGQLEILGIHVAVGTRAAVAIQARERPVVEVRLASAERRVDRRIPGPVVQASALTAGAAPLSRHRRMRRPAGCASRTSAASNGLSRGVCDPWGTSGLTGSAGPRPRGPRTPSYPLKRDLRPKHATGRQNPRRGGLRRAAAEAAGRQRAACSGASSACTGPSSSGPSTCPPSQTARAACS